MTEFAGAYPRDENGWIHFPPDDRLRKEYFPPEVMGHPAKANLYMLESIVEYVSKPGERILDPMAGTGSIMIAATMGRDVVCVEVEEGYHNLQQQALETFATLNPELRSRITLIQGDCLKVLPLPCDHIIFSPPYADILKMPYGARRESTRALSGPYKDAVQEYSKHPANIGRLSRFLYNQTMEKVYALCYQSLRPGGTMTVILQDYMTKEREGRRRVKLGDWLFRVCLRLGFNRVGWFKRYSSGTGFKALWASRGYEVVNDEDIMVFEKRA